MNYIAHYSSSDAVSDNIYLTDYKVFLNSPNLIDATVRAENIVRDLPEDYRLRFIEIR